MQRRPLPPITSLPVLIKSSDQATLDGVGTLFPETEISGLHLVSKKEALLHLDSWKHSDSTKWKLAKGVALLRYLQTDGEKDWERFQVALDLVKDYVPHGGIGEIQYIRSSKKWKEVGFAYSGLMSNLLQTARFVIWFSPQDSGPQPGLFCPDLEVAVYAVAGMGCLRICEKPGCGKSFMPRQEDHIYCPGGKCGNAVRVTRSRHSDPARTKLQRKVWKQRARMKKRRR